jgi:hypothetical protein|tara:strand:- start:852 stop:1019 length:168 start_codon:yes stop_codon:yes gene_type:complete
MANNQRYVPTPEQIAEECEKIRSEWSEDRWKRQRETKDWEVPVIEVRTVSDLPLS